MMKVLYTLNASCRHPTQHFAMSQSKGPHFDLTTGHYTSPQNQFLYSCDQMTNVTNLTTLCLSMEWLLCLFFFGLWFQYWFFYGSHFSNYYSFMLSHADNWTIWWNQSLINILCALITLLLSQAFNFDYVSKKTIFIIYTFHSCSF